jgi:raffinose/stachyose/melibiose transport system substrate-binding protein
MRGGDTLNLWAAGLLFLAAMPPIAAAGAQDTSDTSVDPATSLKVFLNSGDEMALLHETFSRKHPEISIQYDSVGSQNYEIILETMLAAGDPPDIMTVWPGARTAAPAATGRIMDLTDTSAAQAVIPEYSRRFSYRGRIYAICESMSAEGLFYNRDLLRSTGVGVPANWPELLTLSDRLSAAGVQPFSAGFREDWLIQRYTNAAFASLGYGRDPDFDEKLVDGRADFSFVGWVETFERLRALVEAGYLGHDFLSTDNVQAGAALARGASAMVVTTWESFVNHVAGATALDFGLTAFPVNAKDRALYGCWKPGTGLAVSSKIADPEAARAYLDNFVDPDVHERHVRYRGSYPVVRGVTDQMVDPLLAQFVGSFVKTGLFFPGAHYLWPAGMSNAWKVKLQEFVGGVIDTGEMIDWLNTEYRKRPDVYR